MKSKNFGVIIMGAGLILVCISMAGCLTSHEGRVFAASTASNSLFASICYSCWRERKKLERGAKC